MKTTAKHAETPQAIQAKANRQAPVNDILQSYRGKTAQRQSVDEEELLQGKFSMAQLQTGEEELLQKKENHTGLPDHLKSGIENLSGYSMGDVKVHYNSSQPATLQAHAYAQGTDIHVAPGQEQHLPHEAWHVVQQKQGRVKPTMQMKGKVPVNDDAGLEKEADVMGEKSLQNLSSRNISGNKDTLQVVVDAPDEKVFQKVTPNKENQMQGFLADDTETVMPGQMKKVIFLEKLEANVTAMVDQELAVIGQTSTSCPYIEYWFNYYRDVTAEQMERILHLYVPLTRGTKDPEEIIKLVTERVRQGLKEQLSGGTINPVESSEPNKLSSGSDEVTSLAPPVAQTKLKQTALPIHRNNVAQLGKRATKIARPTFIGSVKAMREEAKEMFPTDNIHMAHRLSWQSIRDILIAGNSADIKEMVKNICIPQRDFGIPSKGGVTKGNTEYYDAVIALYNKHKNLEMLAKVLNSSPYNLRPGHGPTNSAIGGDPDAHFDETLPGEPMTPQSKSLLPVGTLDSSDFMTMDAFRDWEHNFYDEYVVPAIKSVNRLM